ncbi:MAG TPA: oxygenase MpaB family protein [Myxococcota bacterium]
MRRLIARFALRPETGQVFDFTQPVGEQALVPPDSVAWRVFKNPVALFVGGVTAVLLELAEPRVRTGVWEHTTFRTDPLTRMERTGMAAMVTVYAARSVAERMIADVVRLHERVRGVTPDGVPYHANDPELLTWVQATASFGFLEAYCRFVRPLDRRSRDQYYAEGREAAKLYGALDAPTSVAELEALFEAMRPKLERSPIVFEFLDILGRTPIFPRPLRGLQSLLIRAAVEITPDWAREILGLEASYGLRAGEERRVAALGRLADRVILPSSPPAQACRRVGVSTRRLR